MSLDMAFEVTTWACVGVPLLLFLIAGIALLKKVLTKNKSRRKKGEYLWESVGAVASLLLTLVGSQLASDALKREEQLNALEGRVLDAIEPRSVRLYERPDAFDVVDKEIHAIESFDEAQGFRVIRAVFHPAPLPGPMRLDDRVIGRKFAASGFPLTVLVGYPPLMAAQRDPDLSYWRAQMQAYLFALLTSKSWESVSGMLKHVTVLYLPWARSYDTWVVASDARAECGLLFFSGGWGIRNDRPRYLSLMLIKDPQVSAGLSDDHLRMQGAGLRYLQQQMQLPAYERDPCTVFCTEGPESGLTPTDLATLDVRVKERVAQWKSETGGTAMPESLKELSRTMRALRGK